MKLNISYPVTACQKSVDIDDERKLRCLYDKRMGQEIDGEHLGDEFKGYVFKISGGNDKQGFPMMQGVLVNHRVRLLLDKNSSCYRTRRAGERKRKSVRGCIAGPDLSVCNLVVIKKGEQDIPGITDCTKPRRLGPKRASKIRKLFNLEKEDDVRKYVIRRETTPKEGKKPRSKAPKIQRLITPVRVQRKRRLASLKNKQVLQSKAAAAAYQQLLALKSKAKRAEKASARRSSRGSKASKPSKVAA